MPSSGPCTTSASHAAMSGQPKKSSVHGGSVIHQSLDTMMAHDPSISTTQQHNSARKLPAPKRRKTSSAQQQAENALWGRASPAIKAYQLHSNTTSAARVYYPVPRPWKRIEQTESTNTTSMVDASPMERWERESVRDQGWNGLLGVYVEDDRDMELDDGWSDCMEAAGSDGTEWGTRAEVSGYRT